MTAQKSTKAPAPIKSTSKSPRKRTGKTKKQIDAQCAARRVEVSRLILEGYTYQEMADRFGCVKSTIFNDVKAIFAAWAEEMKPEERTNWILRELRKLDLMERGIASASESGGLTAIDRRLNIMARRAKMLGLDAPTKIDVGNADINKAIETEFAMMMKRKMDESTGKLEGLAAGGEAGAAQ